MSFKHPGKLELLQAEWAGLAPNTVVRFEWHSTPNRWLVASDMGDPSGERMRVATGGSAEEGLERLISRARR